MVVLLHLNLTTSVRRVVIFHLILIGMRMGKSSPSSWEAKLMTITTWIGIKYLSC